MTTTAKMLADELNRAAEYAGLPAHYTYQAVDAGPDRAHVTWSGCKFTVRLSWAMGNVKRLPDKCTANQIAQALYASHPDRLGVGPKHPERAS